MPPEFDEVVEELEEEELEEELEDDEYSEEESEDDDSEGDEEDFEIEFSDGKKVKASEVVAAFEKLAELEGREQEYNRLVETVNQYDSLFQTLNGNELIQDVLGYWRAGYTNKQIAIGLSKLEKYLDKEPESFETIEQEVDYRVSKKMEALQAELSSLKQAQQIQQTPAYNDQMLWAVAKGNVDSGDFSSPEFIALMKEGNAKYNRNKDLSRQPLDETASAAIVNYALARYKKAPVKQAVKASSKATALPPRITSKVTAKATTKGTGKSKPTSHNDRVNILNSI